MAYCIVGDLSGRLSTAELVQLTDDAFTGAPNMDIIAQAISDAQEEIDGYLRGRYTLPLGSVPGLIKTIAVDLTAYRLYKRRKQLGSAELEELYKGAVSKLEKLQRGVITLPTETGAPAQPSAVLGNKHGRKEFGPGSLGAY
ncbi:MAG: DUF1320 domain-containing protein [Elusimicrobia bacterium]|nr:DUF1320 domain-containing protein [Elusimicrobiota bacterium]